MMDRIEEIRNTTCIDELNILGKEPTCKTTHHFGCDCQLQRYVREKLDLLSEIDRLKGIEKKFNIVKLNYTCNSCPSEPNCRSAWDGYNTCGDCLEDK